MGVLHAAAFDASYVLAFMLAGTFLVYAVLILVMRNVFVREEREGKLAPNKTAATAPAPATTANTTPAVRDSRQLNCIVLPCTGAHQWPRGSRRSHVG